METVITAVIMISLLVLLVFGLSQQLLVSQAQITDSSRVMQERLGDRLRTNLTPADASVTPLGDYVNVIVKNTGSTKLADFQQWDVLLQYTDAGNGKQANWYAYSTQWNYQILQNMSPSTPEVIEPGILNPGEYLLVQVQVAPSIGISTTNQATIATPNGVVATTVFTR